MAPRDQDRHEVGAEGNHMRIKNVEKLDCWITLSEAAEMLGISRQHCWRMAASVPSKWATLRRVGNSTVYVVDVHEVEQKLKFRNQEKS